MSDIDDRFFRRHRADMLRLQRSAEEGAKPARRTALTRPGHSKADQNASRRHPSSMQYLLRQDTMFAGDRNPGGASFIFTRRVSNGVDEAREQVRIAITRIGNVPSPFHPIGVTFRIPRRRSLRRT